MTVVRYLLISWVLGLLAAGAFPQKSTVNTTLNNGKIRLTFASGKLVQDGSLIHYIFRNGFDVVSPDQGLELSGKAGDLYVLNKNKISKIQSGDADGSVNLIKIIGSRQTHITGSHADLRVTGSEDVVKMRGPVKIIDSNAAKHETLVATGDSGTVWTAEQTSGKQSSLKAATLLGDVVIHLDQAPVKEGTKPGKLDATGNRLDYNARTSPPTAKLQGSVKMSGSNGVLDGNGSGPQVTLTLDSKGQVTSLSGGQP